MKPSHELEPGLLPTFRLFIGLQLALTTFGLITHWLLVPFPPPHLVVTLTVFSLLEPGLLFLYLSLPALPRTLKTWYLPLGIVWAAAGPLLDPYFSLINLHAAATNAPAILVQAVLWRQLILLLIPLVILSWQYRLPQLVLFCVLTTTLNLALLSRAFAFPEMISHSLLGIVLIQLVLFFLVGHMIINLMNVQRDQRQRLVAANTRLAHYATTLEQLTLSRERNRLARELHDVLAHTLSGVAVELEGTRTLLRRDPERANGLLNHALQAIRDGLTETRRAVKELRAQPLADLGLALAVRTLAESYAARFAFALDLQIGSDLGDYPVEVQQCVYRIAQEALTNIANHARAQTAQVVLQQKQAQLHLLIRDDGCGFDQNGVQSSHPHLPTATSHYGLLGMRERAALVGGCLAVESQIGQGTRICFFYGGTDDGLGGRNHSPAHL